MDVAMYLAKDAAHSRVFIGGIDVTESLIGIEVRAFIGETTRVLLYLSGNVQLDGEIERLEINPPDRPKAP
jgi:hypothetical protein